jgi:glycosyltransferase involved in cell wall biosynthesis
VHVLVNAHLASFGGGYRQAGVSRYITELLSAMWRISDDTRWTVCTAPGVSRESLGAPDHVRVVASALPTHRPIGRIVWEQVVAPGLLGRERPDVMFCPLNVVPLMAPCPTVVTIHDLAFLRYDVHRGEKRAYLSAMTRLSAERAAHIVTVSEFTRREVIELLGVTPERVTAVPNGFRRTPARPPESSQLESFRTARALPPRFLLFVGTVEPRKNLAGLLRAFALVKDRLAMPLVIVGGRGWRTGPLSELLMQLKLGDRVRFEGFVADEDLPDYYAAATAFVYPSLYEGFGFPPLEAMAAGTPVVTSNTSSLPELVGTAALTVTPGDERALADALVRVVEDDTLRARLRAAGLTRVDQFSWDSCARATLGVLRSIGSGGSSAAVSAPNAA